MRKPEGRISSSSLPTRYGPHALLTERAGCTQIFERTLDGLPRCVLREICAENHFERRLAQATTTAVRMRNEQIVHPSKSLSGSGLSFFV